MLATKRGLALGLSLAALVLGVSAEQASAQTRVRFRPVPVPVSAHQLGPGANVIVRANPLQPLVRGTVGPNFGTNVLAPSGPGNSRIFYNNPYGYYNNNPRLTGGLNALYGGGAYGSTGGYFGSVPGGSPFPNAGYAGYPGYGAGLPYGGVNPYLPAAYGFPGAYPAIPSGYVNPAVFGGVPPGYYSY